MDHLRNVFTSSRLTLSIIRIRTRVKHGVEWNSFPGSVVHGILGFHLKKSVCIEPSGNCAKCSLTNSCPYAFFIEAARLSVLEKEKQQAYERQCGLFLPKPHPICVSVIPCSSSHSETESEILVELIFFGAAAERGVPVLLAIVEAFKEGIGRQSVKEKRGSLEVISLSNPVTEKQILPESLRYDQGLPFVPIEWSQLAASHSIKSGMEFTAPVRLQSEGRIRSVLPVSDLVLSVFRRVASIALYYCGVELPFDYRPVLEKTDLLGPLALPKRASVSRYSSRQKTRIQQDGMTGVISLPELPAELLPWLSLCQYMGIGKGTSMGFGRYQLV